MTQPSKFSGTGLSILISMPLVQGEDVVGNFTDAVSDYTHTISSNGGYASADFTISGNNEFLENWLGRNPDDPSAQREMEEVKRLLEAGPSKDSIPDMVP